MTKIISSTSKPKLTPPETISLFIRKTYDILQDNKFPDAVGWNSEGDALVIHKPEEFSSKVLPAYFKHNQVTSFIRQLNLYSFHKLKAPKEDHVYQHDLFRRGKRHLLKGIKRRSQGLNLEAVQKSIETMKPSTSSAKDTSAISYENRLLRDFHRDTLSRINTLENHVKDLTIQNQALWNEVNHQEDKKGVLKEFITKIFSAYDTPMEELASLFPLDEASTSVNAISEKKDFKGSALKDKDCKPCISVGCLLKLEEDYPDSTEAGSHASPQRSDVSNKRKKSVDLTESLPFISDLLTKISNKMKEETEESVDTKSRECQELWENGYGWSLETQYLRKLQVLHRSFDEPFLNKNGSESQNIIGKRNFFEFVNRVEPVRRNLNSSSFFVNDDSEELESTRKILHENQTDFNLMFNEKYKTDNEE